MSTRLGETSVADLLTEGDAHARAGNPRSALSFYREALRGATTQRIDPATAMRLREAQAFIQARAQEFERALDAALAYGDPTDLIGSTRLSHALDLMKGRREIFPQQPSMFYYPYLAQRQFFEREEFAWVAALESNCSAIRKELEALLAADVGFRPYVEDEPDRPARDFHGLNNNRIWTALYLYKQGTPVPEIAERCPATMRALAEVPLSQIGERTPSVFFSRLEPGAHIPAHCGMLNSRVICHLPLIVPSGCWLRVGNETREWEQGKLLIFDDSIEHEAKNPSSEVRVVLIFDIWRPELSASERDGISAIFNAIDTFSPQVKYGD